jgi:hypothetical protein
MEGNSWEFPTRIDFSRKIVLLESMGIHGGILVNVMDAQVLCYVFNGHHGENPLPSRIVEKLVLGGLLSPEKPLTVPEGKSLMAVYPKKMRLTRKGIVSYSNWLKSRNHAFPTDMKRLEETLS